MTLKARITEDMKNAMRAKDATRLSTIRMLLAAMKQREVDERIELSDADVVTIIDRMIKQRRESVDLYRQGNREELAAAEEAEIAVITRFLPAQMDDAAAYAAIQSIIAETGASPMKDMGRVMALVKERLAGQADMSKASQAVKARLS